MNAIVDKIYIHAKINALRSSLLAKEDYLGIARSGNLHPEMQVPPAPKDAAEIILIKEKMFREQIGALILLAGLNDFYSDFFRAFLLLFELGNIKNVLLRSYGKKQLFAQWNDVSPYDTIDESLRKNDIILDDLEKALRGTVFSGVIDSGDPGQYEALESRIDFIALKNLLAFGVRLLPSDRAVFNEIMIMKIISMKIVWDARRGMHFATADDFPQFDPADAFRDSRITADEVEAAENEISKRIGGEYPAAGDEKHERDIPALEMTLDRLFVAHVTKTFSRDFHGICPVISYAWSVYYQIRNLFAIVEGRYLGVSPETIMQHVVTGV